MSSISTNVATASIQMSAVWSVASPEIMNRFAMVKKTMAKSK